MEFLWQNTLRLAAIALLAGGHDIDKLIIRKGGQKMCKDFYIKLLISFYRDDIADFI
jgi:hypothetical protein